MSLHTTIAIVLLAWVSLPSAPVRAGQGWWNAKWRWRMPIVVEEKLGVARTDEPVVISGRALRRHAGLRHITIDSLRLVCDGKPWPVQVDEKDTHGVYYHQGAGNDVVDNQDEIVFQVSLKAREKRRYDLYFGVTPGWPKVHDPTSLVFKQQRGDRRACDATVSNGLLTVGIRGGFTSKAYGGHGKGSITRLAVKGVKLFEIGHSWGNHLHMPFPAAAWSNPVVVTTGPVRLIACVKVEGVDLPWGKKPVNGSVHRYFVVYHALPYLVCVERIGIPTSAPKAVLSYAMNAHPSGDPRDWVNERVVAPGRGGTVVTLDYKSKGYHVTTGRREWAAYHNAKRKVGLAVFCPPHKTASVYAHLLPRGGKLDTIMTSAWGAMHSSAQMGIRVSVDPRRPIRHAIGFCGLRTARPQEAVERFRCLWQTPLSRHVQCQPVEEKP